MPGEAKFVFEPAALTRSAALSQLFPVIVDLLLAIATDDERDRGSEFVHRASVDGAEFEAADLELHQMVAFRRASCNLFDAQDFGVWEYGGIELGGFFGLTIEP